MDTLESVCMLIVEREDAECQIKVSNPAFEPEWLQKQIDEMFRGAVKLTWSAFLAPTEESLGWVKVRLEFESKAMP